MLFLSGVGNNIGFYVNNITLNNNDNIYLTIDKTYIQQNLVDASDGIQLSEPSLVFYLHGTGYNYYNLTSIRIEPIYTDLEETCIYIPVSNLGHLTATFNYYSGIPLIIDFGNLNRSYRSEIANLDIYIIQ